MCWCPWQLGNTWYILQLQPHSKTTFSRAVLVFAAMTQLMNPIRRMAKSFFFLFSFRSSTALSSLSKEARTDAELWGKLSKLFKIAGLDLPWFDYVNRKQTVTIAQVVLVLNINSGTCVGSTDLALSGEGANQATSHWLGPCAGLRGTLGEYEVSLQMTETYQEGFLFLTRCPVLRGYGSVVFPIGHISCKLQIAPVLRKRRTRWCRRAMHRPFLGVGLSASNNPSPLSPVYLPLSLHQTLHHLIRPNGSPYPPPAPPPPLPAPLFLASSPSSSSPSSSWSASASPSLFPHHHILAFRSSGSSGWKTCCICQNWFSCGAGFNLQWYTGSVFCCVPVCSN